MAVRRRFRLRLPLLRAVSRWLRNAPISGASRAAKVKSDGEVPNRDRTNCNSRRKVSR